MQKFEIENDWRFFFIYLRANYYANFGRSHVKLVMFNQWSYCKQNTCAYRENKNKRAWWKLLYSLRSCSFLSLWKFHSCSFIPNCTRNHVITNTNRRWVWKWTNKCNTNWMKLQNYRMKFYIFNISFVKKGRATHFLLVSWISSR